MSLIKNFKRKTLSTLLIIVISLAFLEISVLVMYGVFNHRFFPYTKYRSLILSVAVNSRSSEKVREPGTVFQGGMEIVHPYFGYIQNPDGKQISEYGFIDPGLRSPLSPATSGLTVAVLGGSFAMQTCMYAEEALARRLSSLGSPVRIINLSLGGYKQPQQLITLTYFLSIGMNFDLVLNIDGFNEVAIPTAENLPNGVYPLFPREWHLRMANVHKPEISMKLIRLDLLRERKRRLASFFDQSLLSFPAFGCALWRALDRNIEQREYEALLAISDTHADSRPMVTGPSFDLRAEEDIYEYLSKHWARCSILLNEICEAEGISYFHFLQPNQYVPGSKPMGGKEQKIAIDLDHIYRPGVIAGYPHLRKFGEKKLKGIKFYDMTMVFHDDDEVLYADDCCHLNEKGYKIFAEAIGRIIVETKATQGQPKPCLGINDNEQ